MHTQSDTKIAFLIKQSTTAEITAVLGHELGHWQLSHTIKNLKDRLGIEGCVGTHKIDEHFCQHL